MKNLISSLLAVGFLAKDLHYRQQRGNAFYAVHLLADKIGAIASHADELIEVTYLSDGIEVPPYEEFVSDALKIYKSYASEKGLKEKLLSALQILNARCEDVSRMDPLKTGFKAIVDSIATECLVDIGLLRMSIKQ